MYKITELEIPEVIMLEPFLNSDLRGKFAELYKKDFFKDLNLPNFVQDNISTSKKNVIRGLHFQSEPFPQGKLVSIISGQIFDVILDIRPSSPTFGNHISLVLDSSKYNMIFIPPGFAHGFCTLTDESIVHYKNTANFSSKFYSGIRWNDPELEIKWPIKNPITSKKDNSLPFLKDLIKSKIDLTDVK